MYVKVRKIVVLAVILAIFACSTSAYAADETSWQDRLQGWYDSAKEKTGELMEAGKEKAPEIIDKGKEAAGAAADKAGELYQAGKEKLPDVVESAKDKVHDAQDAISDWNAGQQDQFWGWVDGQVNGTDGSDQPKSPNAGDSPDAQPSQDIVIDPPPQSDPDTGLYQPTKTPDEVIIDGQVYRKVQPDQADDATSEATPDVQTSTEDEKSDPKTISWLSGLGLVVGIVLFVVVFLRILDAPFRAAAEERRRENEWRKWQEQRQQRRRHND